MEAALTSVTVCYGSLTAVDDVSLSFKPGEVHAIVGENGAGKSTLMHALFGLVSPQSGTLAIDGKPSSWAPPAVSLRRGLGMVHQHFMLQDDMTVLENVILCEEPASHFGFVDFATAKNRLRSLSDAHGMGLDPDARVGSLSVGERQVVEILKVLFRNARLLIFDEPTSVLTPMEKERLFEILRSFRASGKAIALITHKIGEVMEIADQVSVMRGGKLVLSRPIQSTGKDEIARAIIGGDLPSRIERQSVEAGDTLLSVENVLLPGRITPAPLSFSVRSGEIVGVAGVSGNGQTELVQVLTGERRAPAGSIKLCGIEAGELSIRKRRRSGLCYIPEDRQRVGLVQQATVTQNANAGRSRKEIARGPFLNFAAMAEFARTLVSRYRIHARDVSSPASTLSGGNKQKLVVARELSRNSPVIVAENPTWGVDIGAIDFIHRQLSDMRKSGHAILLISTELDEIIALSDRVLVMFEGAISGEISGNEMTREKIGHYMTAKAETAA